MGETWEPVGGWCDQSGPRSASSFSPWGHEEFSLRSAVPPWPPSPSLLPSLCLCSSGNPLDKETEQNILDFSIPQCPSSQRGFMCHAALGRILQSQDGSPHPSATSWVGSLRSPWPKCRMHRGNVAPLGVVQLGCSGDAGGLSKGSLEGRDSAGGLRSLIQDKGLCVCATGPGVRIPVSTSSLSKGKEYHWEPSGLGLRTQLCHTPSVTP